MKETLQKEQVAVSAYLLGGFPQAQRKRIVLQKSRGGQNRNYYEEDTDSDGSEDASNNFVDLDESPEVCLATSVSSSCLVTNS